MTHDICRSQGVEVPEQVWADFRQSDNWGTHSMQNSLALENNHCASNINPDLMEMYSSGPWTVHRNCIHSSTYAMAILWICDEQEQHLRHTSAEPSPRASSFSVFFLPWWLEWANQTSPTILFKATVLWKSLQVFSNTCLWMITYFCTAHKIIFKDILLRADNDSVVDCCFFYLGLLVFTKYGQMLLYT